MPKVSIGVLIALLLFCGLGPLVWPWPADAFDKTAILAPPSIAHPFGCDLLGRDVMARVMEGGRISLLVGMMGAAIATALAMIVGTVAALFRGVVDRATVVMIDLLLAFPTFFLLLALIAYVPAGAGMLIGVIGLTGWMSLARMVRSEAFALSSRPYVKTALLAGRSRWWVVIYYYLPLLAPLGLVGFTFGASGAILAESGLSFLGLGIMPPSMSWGTILADGKEVMDVAWWVSFFPGAMIFIVSYALITIADALQRAANRRAITVG
ncbi:MAG: ABC transporter permease [Campylobacterales bacterium]